MSRIISFIHWIRGIAPQNFLTSLLSRIDKEKAPEAHVILLTAIAKAKLLFGDKQGTKTDIDAAQKILDSLDSAENSVNAAYYRVAADYYKVRQFLLFVL